MVLVVVELTVVCLEMVELGIFGASVVAGVLTVVPGRSMVPGT